MTGQYHKGHFVIFPQEGLLLTARIHIPGGGFREGGPCPGPPIFALNIFRALYLPLCQYFSSYIDLKIYILCVLLFKYNLTILVIVST